MKTWTITFSVDDDKRLKIEYSGSDFTNVEKMGILEILKHNLVSDSFLNKDKETR